MTANAKKYFRPTLETLENREMMDAGIGAAAMHRMMPDITQGAQIRLLAQETSALQNQNNPLSKIADPGKPGVSGAVPATQRERASRGGSHLLRLVAPCRSGSS